MINTFNPHDFVEVENEQESNSNEAFIESPNITLESNDDFEFKDIIQSKKEEAENLLKKYTEAELRFLEKGSKEKTSVLKKDFVLLYVIRFLVQEHPDKKLPSIYNNDNIKEMLVSAKDPKLLPDMYRILIQMENPDIFENKNRYEDAEKRYADFFREDISNPAHQLALDFIAKTK